MLTVSMFLYYFINNFKNRLLPNNIMMIRNYAQEQQGRPSQIEVPIQIEVQSNSDSRNISY
jgi:hypothetical protein